MFGMVNECRLLSVPRHGYKHCFQGFSCLPAQNLLHFSIMQLFICLFICFVGGVLREDGAVRRQTPPGQAGQKEDRGACPYH